MNFTPEKESEQLPSHLTSSQIRVAPMTPIRRSASYRESLPFSADRKASSSDMHPFLQGWSQSSRGNSSRAKASSSSAHYLAGLPAATSPLPSSPGWVRSCSSQADPISSQPEVNPFNSPVVNPISSQDATSPLRMFGTESRAPAAGPSIFALDGSHRRIAPMIREQILRCHPYDSQPDRTAPPSVKTRSPSPASRRSTLTLPVPEDERDPIPNTPRPDSIRSPRSNPDTILTDGVPQSPMANAESPRTPLGTPNRWSISTEPIPPSPTGRAESPRTRFRSMSEFLASTNHAEANPSQEDRISTSAESNHAMKKARKKARRRKSQKTQPDREMEPEADPMAEIPRQASEQPVANRILKKVVVAVKDFPFPWLNGVYAEGLRCHDRPTYEKQGGETSCFLYFSDSVQGFPRSRPSVSGWWFGPWINSEKVWAHHSESTLYPPGERWSFPGAGSKGWIRPEDARVHVVRTIRHAEELMVLDEVFNVESNFQGGPRAKAARDKPMPKSSGKRRRTLLDMDDDDSNGPFIRRPRHSDAATAASSHARPLEPQLTRSCGLQANEEYDMLLARMLQNTEDMKTGRCPDCGVKFPAAQLRRMTSAFADEVDMSCRNCDKTGRIRMGDALNSTRSEDIIMIGSDDELSHPVKTEVLSQTEVVVAKAKPAAKATQKAASKAKSPPKAKAVAAAAKAAALVTNAISKATQRALAKATPEKAPQAKVKTPEVTGDEQCHSCQAPLQKEANFCAKCGQSRRKDTPAPVTPATPIAATPTAGKECVICLDQPRECLFTPCGHWACCTKCGEKCIKKKPKQCPICRKKITKVQRVFDV